MPEPSIYTKAEKLKTSENVPWHVPLSRADQGHPVALGCRDQCHPVALSCRDQCHPVPLSCVDQCQYKICGDNNRPAYVNYEVPPTKHYLEDRDHYWADFLKAQQDSTANYLYKIQIFGHNKDPTLVKKQPFPETLVNQRLFHMPYVGGLLKADMFYILSFILNIKSLSTEKQWEYMWQLQNWKLLDLATLNYMLIMARHHNTQLTPQELQQFQHVCQQLIEHKAPKDCYRNYFKPDAIFLKCMVEIDPYELAYLKNILETEGKLDREQFLYLVNFVERLQELSVERRDQYLKLLHERNILKTPCFDSLVQFMRSKAKRCDRRKLQMLLNELFKLMDVGPCEPEPEEIPYQVPAKYTTDFDYPRIAKALNCLMKPNIIPNIVRVMELRNFLNNVLRLPPYQMEYVFHDMKNARLLTSCVFNFIRNFVYSGQLGKGDPEKIRTMLMVMRDITEGPYRTGIAYKVDMPKLKGPVRWPIQKLSSEAVDKTTKVEKKPDGEETQKEGAKENKKEEDKKKSEKQSKKGTDKKRAAKKGAPKKAGRHKKKK